MKQCRTKVKYQKGRFLGMLLGALGVRLLQKTLPGKEINRAGDGIIKAGYGSKGSLIKRKLIPAYLFTNIGMQKYN